VQVDVGDRESVRALAHSAISRGPVVQVVTPQDCLRSKPASRRSCAWTSTAWP
jgi:hypothetical protein